jgi:hypothetical protein
VAIVVIFGMPISLIIYGILMTVIRVICPHKLKKYVYMKNKYGNKIGFILHFLFYFTNCIWYFINLQVYTLKLKLCFFK